MIASNCIFAECNADTLLAKRILKVDHIPHYKGIGEVSKAMELYKNDSHVVVGLVDGHKFRNETTFIKRFTAIIKEGNTIVQQLPDSNKYLIRLIPSFETWIFNAAVAGGVDLPKCNYPTIKSIETATKSDQVDKNQNIVTFINTIIKADPPEIQLLSKWLKYAHTG